MGPRTGIALHMSVPRANALLVPAAAGEKLPAVLDMQLLRNSLSLSNDTILPATSDLYRFVFMPCPARGGGGRLENISTGGP